MEWWGCLVILHNARTIDNRAAIFPGATRRSIIYARTRTTHTCNGWPQKQETKPAMEPAHDYTVLITPFRSQERSKSFVKGGGFGSKVPSSRHITIGIAKGNEFNLPDSLAISSLVCILMAPISSRNRIYVEESKQIKSSSIHKTVFGLTPQKPFI